MSYPQAQVNGSEENNEAGEEGDNSNICCFNNNDASGSSSDTSSTNTDPNNQTNNFTNTTIAGDNPQVAGLRQFWHSFRERLMLGVNTASDRAVTSATRQIQQERRDERVPILAQASVFDTSRGVPAIQTDQIVLPGSDLQRQMAKAMVLELEDQEDECVICMESFDPTNPRMPTLCGCGENKTYFHLPCMYQWIQQSSDCPSCRKRLQWEEF